MIWLAPVAAAFGLAVPAIVALYFLRVRRTEVPVSSTLLWRRMVRDRQANVPWQRLRFSWLLALQVLAAAALVLALMRPAHSSPAPLAAHTIVMVDASATMQAGDVRPSRFAAARRKAADLISRLGPRDRLTLMELSSTPKVLASAVGDRRVLQQALGRLTPDNAGADLQQALALAASVSGAGTDTELVLLSDGITDPVQAPVALPFRLSYQPIGSSPENLAITALSGQPAPQGGPEGRAGGQVGFVHVQNFGRQRRRVQLDWTVDGRLKDVRSVALDGGAGADLLFPLAAGAERLSASLSPHDAFALDDTARALARPAAGYRVLLVTDGDVFLRQALGLLPGLQVTTVSSTAYAAQPTDVYVFDRFLPSALPNAPLFVVDPPTGTAALPVGGTFSPGTLRPAGPDPLLADVSLADVHVAASRDLSRAGFGRALVTSQGGPLMLLREEPSRGVLVGFDLHDSDLPLRAAFPILVDRLMRWLLPQAAQPGYAPGQQVALGVSGADLAVRRPDGREVPAQGSVFTDTGQAGVYDVVRGGRVVSRFAVNVFSPQLSAIAPVTRLNLAGSVAAAAAAGGRRRQQEWWPWVAGAALVLLSAEWAVFHRGL